MLTADDVLTEELSITAYVKRGDKMVSIDLGVAKPAVDGGGYKLRIMPDFVHLEKNDTIIIHLADARAKTDLKKRVLKQQAKLMEELQINLKDFALPKPKILV